MVHGKQFMQSGGQRTVSKRLRGRGEETVILCPASHGATTLKDNKQDTAGEVHDRIGVPLTAATLLPDGVRVSNERGRRLFRTRHVLRSTSRWQESTTPVLTSSQTTTTQHGGARAAGTTLIFGFGTVAVKRWRWQ